MTEVDNMVTASAREQASDITDEKLALITARAEAATPGPWEQCGAVGVGHWRPFPQLTGSRWDREFHRFAEVQHAGNREFMTHAREDVPRLIAALRASRAEVERLREQNDGLYLAVLAEGRTVERLQAENEQMNYLLDEQRR